MPELADVLEDYAERWSDLTAEERIAALGLAVRVVVMLERRSGALVVEREQPDGTTTIEAKKTGGPIGTLLAVLAIFVTPVTIALIEVLGR